MQRAYDQIIHDVALQNLKVIFCIDRGGLVGEDGATHQGAFDLSYLRIVPNITEMAPLNEIELQDMLYSATLPEYTGPISIRYPRGCCQGLKLPKDFNKIEIGKAVKIKEGKDIAVLSIGTIGNNVEKAIEIAEKENISVAHYNMRFLKPLDKSAIDEALNNCKKIVTVEDGTVIGGLYGAVCEYIVGKGIDNIKITGLGIPDRFIEHSTVNEQLIECGLDADSISKSILAATKN